MSISYVLRQAALSLAMMAVTAWSTIHIISSYTQTNSSVIDFLRPQPFNYLKDSVAQAQKPDLHRIKIYLIYFKKIAGFYPAQYPEVYGLIGYCYDQMGDLTKAAEYYKEAISLNSGFFWFYYNLGMIYAQMGDYREARQYFVKASAQDPGRVLMVILSSRQIYIPLLFDSKSVDIKEKLIAALKVAYTKAAILSRLNDEQIKGAPLNLELF